ncbi:MAG: kelch repeat-containing protein, partial [bacterium]
LTLGLILVAMLQPAGAWAAFGFGPPVALNTNAATDSGDDFNPQVTTDGVGHWVSVWQSADSLGGTIGTDEDLLVSRSTDNGASWSAPAALNSNAATDFGDDYSPQVTTDRAGNWVAVWKSFDSLGGTIGTDGDILVSRSTDNGDTWTTATALNTNAATDFGDDDWPQVTTDGTGNWVAVWKSFDSLGGTIGTDGDILVSRSMDNGVVWTAPTALNTNAAVDSGADAFPQITTDGAGNWVAVWYSSDSLGGTIGPDDDILFSTSSDISVDPSLPSWTAVATTGTLPSARHSAGFARLPFTSNILLFGGRLGNDSLSSQTFSLVSGSFWVVPFTSQPPSPREGPAMGPYDSANQVVLFGGYDGTSYLPDTWLYNSTGGWSHATPSTPPSSRSYAAMVYDGIRSRTVMFGGRNAAGPLNETWRYQFGQWAQIFPTGPPSARHSHAMANMLSMDRVVLFGGIDTGGNVLGDTWLFDGNGTSWGRQVPAHAPPARYAAGMDYDSSRRRVTLFGGLDSNHQPLSDTWEFDGTDWYQVLMSSAPSARAGHQVVFSPNLNRMILFGGATGLGREPGAPASSGANAELFSLNFVQPTLVRAIFRKNPSTTPGDPVTSDRVHLTFDQDMRVNQRIPSNNPFFLPVSGDSLGSTFAMDLAQYNQRQVNVTLGASPTLTPDGVFATGVVTPFSPSGIDAAAVPPSSLLLTNRYGLPPLDTGVIGSNDTALDIGNVLGSNGKVFNGTEGGTMVVQQDPGLTYKKHSIHVPVGTFNPGESWLFLIDPADEDLGVASAFKLSVDNITGGAALAQTGSVTLPNPVTVTVEYQNGDFDPDIGQKESLLRIHHLVEVTTGTLRYEPVID